MLELVKIQNHTQTECENCIIPRKLSNWAHINYKPFRPNIWNTFVVKKSILFWYSVVYSTVIFMLLTGWFRYTYTLRRNEILNKYPHGRPVCLHKNIKKCVQIWICLRVIFYWSEWYPNSDKRRLRFAEKVNRWILQSKNKAFSTKSACFNDP